MSANLKKYLAYAWAIFFESSLAADFAESFIRYGLENQHRSGKGWILTCMALGSDGGLVVSILAFYSDDPGSNPTYS